MTDKLKIEYSYSRIFAISLLVSITLAIILKNHFEFYGYAMGLILLLFFYFDSKDLIIEKGKLTYKYYLRDIPFLKPKNSSFSSEEVEIHITHAAKAGWFLTIKRKEGEKKQWKKILFNNHYSMGKVDWDISIDNLILKLKEFGFSVYCPHKDGRHFLNVNFDAILNQEVIINPLKKNNLIDKYIPNSGKIIKRLIIDEELDWYLIKLNNKIKNDPYLEDLIIVRTKNKFEYIVKGDRIIIAFFIIPNHTNIEDNNLKKDKLEFGGWASEDYGITYIRIKSSKN